MTRAVIVVGTDTNVGKTVFAAALAGALGAYYWKPIQCGLDGGGDAAQVAVLSGLPRERILPSAYTLAMPASPHRSAEAEGIAIDLARLSLPDVAGRDVIVVEAAGGLLVPITRSLLQIELLKRWDAPAVLVARTALGTINHSLLSLEALRARAISVVGIAFSGEESRDSEQTIAEMGSVRRLGRLTHLDPLDRETLARAFAKGFRKEDFA